MYTTGSTTQPTPTAYQQVRRAVNAQFTQARISRALADAGYTVRRGNGFRLLIAPVVTGKH